MIRTVICTNCRAVVDEAMADWDVLCASGVCPSCGEVVSPSQGGTRNDGTKRGLIARRVDLLRLDGVEAQPGTNRFQRHCHQTIIQERSD
jgi:hypothetical protein